MHKMSIKIVLKNYSIIDSQALNANNLLTITEHLQHYNFYNTNIIFQVIIFQYSKKQINVFSKLSSTLHWNIMPCLIKMLQMNTTDVFSFSQMH